MKTPNEYGTYEPEAREELARYGRWYAQVKLSHCEDGLYRYGLDFMYGYGGLACPISDSSQGYATYNAAKDAGTQELLAHLPSPRTNEPQSAQDELRELREQIEQNHRQPSLF
jgi:hypothetical protein